MSGSGPKWRQAPIGSSYGSQYASLAPPPLHSLPSSWRQQPMLRIVHKVRHVTGFGFQLRSLLQHINGIKVLSSGVVALSPSHDPLPAPPPQLLPLNPSLPPCCLTSFLVLLPPMRKDRIGTFRTRPFTNGMTAISTADTGQRLLTGNLHVHYS